MAEDWRRRLRGDLEKTSPGATRGHTGREPSDPPFFPPEPIESSRPKSSPSSFPPVKAEKHYKAVWGILVVLFATASAGWTARAAFTKPLVDSAIRDALKAEHEEMNKLRTVHEVDQRSNQETFGGIKTDIEWLKRKDVVVQQQPLSEKPNKRP